MDELAVELGLDPMEVRRRNWITPRGVPVHHGGRAGLRLGQLRGGHRQGDGAARATTSCGPSRPRAARRTTRCSWASASPPTPRCAAWRRRGCWARCATAPAAGSRPPSGCCPPARSRWSPARPRTARATRRRGARSSPTSSACRSRTSTVLHGDTRVVAQGHGHVRVALARGRRHRDGDGLREGARQGQGRRRAHARVLRRTTSSSPTARSGCGATPRRPRRSPTCALAVFAAHDLPDGIEPQLDSEATFDPSTFSFPHGTHLCAAEVDTETGRVTIRKYVAVDDVGKVINPLIVEGQVHGGVAQGIAQALFEEAVYDESGNLITGSFAEYLLPSAADLPDDRHRPDRDAGDHASAGRQGRRRGRHDRLHAGRGQRDRRRAAPARRQRHPDAAARPSGCGGRHRRRRQRTGRSRGMIPVGVRLRRGPSTVEEAVAALRRRPARTPRCSPAGRACCRCCGCGWPPRRWWSTSAGSPQLRGIRVDGDDAGHRGDDHARRGGRVRAGRGRGAAGRGGGRDGRRPAGAPPGHARRLASPTPTRPVTCRRPRWRWTRRWWWPGRPGGATIAARDFFTDIFTTALGPDEVLVEVRFPRMTGLDRPVREVPPHRPGLGAWSASRRRSGGRTARSPRPGWR